VPFIGHSAKALPSVRAGTRQRKVAVTAFGAVTASLLIARERWHSAKTGLFAERRPEGARQSSVHFAECLLRGTRQSSGHFAECFCYTLGKELFFKDFKLFFPHHFTQAHIHTGILYIHTGILFEILHTQPNSRKSYRHNQI
jgi:hypothetical protein